MSGAARSVFISFSSKDRKIAETICTALEARGFSCWMSSRDVRPGENYQVAIVHAISAAKVLLLVFSSNTNESDEIKKELSLASKRRLMVIPVRTEDVLPDEGFSYELATRQWIDLFAGWEAAMAQLADQLSLVVPAGPRAATPSPAAAGGSSASSGFPLRQQTIMGAAAAAVLLALGLVYFTRGSSTVATTQPSGVVAPGPALAVVAPSRSVDEALRCMKADPDESIKGCSQNLAEADVTGLTRATYYKIRGSSYARKFEYALAIADFNSAIALAPRDGSIFFVRAAIRRVQGDQTGADADAAQARALGYTPPH